jgi:two-component system CheB/CheR fusion protein
LESQEVLIGELQHRTRNLISVVEAIARETMATTGSVDAFMAEFTTRLAALSRVQGLLSRSERHPITIGALLGMELGAVGAAVESPRVTVSGPEVQLRKRSVQTLALAIHELATNARKYGALANDTGQLEVRWNVEPCGVEGCSCLVLEWRETGTKQRLDRAAPRRCGYGRTLIEQGLPYALSAQTEFELEDDTFRCSIKLPLEPEGPRGDDLVES